MEVEHVAYGMRSSYGFPYITPDLVIAWERGVTAPTGPELTALAGVLWASVDQLAGPPRTLREYRVARGLAPEDVARGVGLDPHSYRRMEEGGRWRGTERQTAALTALLGLSLADLVTVMGHREKLAELLRSAVTTRWQQYVRPLAKMLPLERRFIEPALRELHAAYQERTALSAGRTGDAGRDFLEHISERFWSAVTGGGRARG